jgi:hypothetical protein
VQEKRTCVIWRTDVDFVGQAIFTKRESLYWCCGFGWLFSFVFYLSVCFFWLGDGAGISLCGVFCCVVVGCVALGAYNEDCQAGQPCEVSQAHSVKKGAMEDGQHVLTLVTSYNNILANNVARASHPWLLRI